MWNPCPSSSNMTNKTWAALHLLQSQQSAAVDTPCDHHLKKIAPVHNVRRNMYCFLTKPFCNCLHIKTHIKLTASDDILDTKLTILTTSLSVHAADFCACPAFDDTSSQYYLCCKAILLGACSQSMSNCVKKIVWLNKENYGFLQFSVSIATTLIRQKTNTSYLRPSIIIFHFDRGQKRSQGAWKHQQINGIWCCPNSIVVYFLKSIHRHPMGRLLLGLRSRPVHFRVFDFRVFSRN